MPRLIDADKLGLTDFEIIMCGGDYKEALKMLIEKIENAPTVDAEPVVRCKDCKYYLGDGLDECELMDAKSIIASLNSKRWYSDFFCAWGERREDGETN